MTDYRRAVHEIFLPPESGKQTAEDALAFELVTEIEQLRKALEMMIFTSDSTDIHTKAHAEDRARAALSPQRDSDQEQGE